MTFQIFLLTEAVWRLKNIFLGSHQLHQYLHRQSCLTLALKSVLQINTHSLIWDSIRFKTNRTSRNDNTCPSDDHLFLKTMLWRYEWRVTFFCRTSKFLSYDSTVLVSFFNYLGHCTQPQIGITPLKLCFIILYMPHYLGWGTVNHPYFP